MDDLFSDSVDRLFEHISTPAAIRRVEGGESIEPLWNSIEESGFLDALVPEASDGAGLTLAQAFPLFLSAGRYAVPVPFAQTMLARAYLTQAGVAVPTGPIALVGRMAIPEAGEPLRALVPFGQVAEWVLADVGEQTLLLPLQPSSRGVTAGHGSLTVDVQWSEGVSAATRVPALPQATLQIDSLAAASFATLIAGAADRVLNVTLEHAGQRTQFGKPIGKFQAVQSQISVMAERAWVARMAAQLACESVDWRPAPLKAAVGKARASEAAVIVADISHAVHGAIGVTEEYDLQLYTRRLREWRHACGAETYWEGRLGHALLSRQNETALSFMCQELT